LGQWTGVQTWSVEAIHISLLPTGKVLFWQSWRESVGLWDPATNQFSNAGLPVGGASVFNPFCSGHAWLADGRLFVAGGHIQNYNGERRSDIYNPFTNSWASVDATPNVPNMGTNDANPATSGKRWYPSATTLATGDVLVTSGDMMVQGDTNRRSQVYQAATNTWRNLPSADRASDDLLPQYPRMFLAPDGRAISLSDKEDDTEYLDTSGTGQWEFVDRTLDDNLANYGPAVMYDVGKIAFMGGGHSPTANISILDLNEENPAWRFAAEPMAAPRRQNNATILADGTVLITGGTSTTDWNNPAGRVRVPEIWDPATEEVTQVAEASDIFRGYHSTALLLPDGRVLSAGGNHDETTGIVEQKNAEIYSPPYLFKGPRPNVTAAPDVVELGDTIFVETPDGADVANALMVVPGSVTHAQNWTQRINYLDVVETAGGVNLTLPESGNHAPPGYYMLFLVNSAGVPSMAEWMRVGLRTMQPDNADFNGDLAVDGADFLVWQLNLGGPAGATRAGGDANDDGVVDGDDLAVWQAQIGNPPPSADSSAEVVPEPSAQAILGGLILGAAIMRRRRMPSAARAREAS
jgi:galactose oxidase